MRVPGGLELLDTGRDLVVGLAGLGGPGDQPVRVQHGQRHGHLEAGVDLLALDRPAQPDRRLGEPVAGGQPGKPFVHPPLLDADPGALFYRMSGVTAPLPSPSPGEARLPFGPPFLIADPAAARRDLTLLRRAPAPP